MSYPRWLEVSDQCFTYRSILGHPELEKFSLLYSSSEESADSSCFSAPEWPNSPMISPCDIDGDFGDDQEEPADLSLESSEEENLELNFAESGPSAPWFEGSDADSEETTSPSSESASLASLAAASAFIERQGRVRYLKLGDWLSMLESDFVAFTREVSRWARVDDLKKVELISLGSYRLVEGRNASVHFFPPLHDLQSIGDNCREAYQLFQQAIDNSEERPNIPPTRRGGAFFCTAEAFRQAPLDERTSKKFRCQSRKLLALARISCGRIDEAALLFSQGFDEPTATESLDWSFLLSQDLTLEVLTGAARVTQALHEWAGRGLKYSAERAVADPLIRALAWWLKSCPNALLKFYFTDPTIYVLSALAFLLPAETWLGRVVLVSFWNLTPGDAFMKEYGITRAPAAERYRNHPLYKDHDLYLNDKETLCTARQEFERVSKHRVANYAKVIHRALLSAYYCPPGCGRQPGPGYEKAKTSFERSASLTAR